MKKTKSYTYILPMMADILMYKPQIANVFIKDKEYPQYDGKLFILYKYSGEREFIKYEEKLKSHPLYVNAYDPDTQHVMMVFNVPEKDKLNYFRFKDSQYSKFSEAYKKKVLSFHRISKEHPVFHVLYRTEVGYKSLEHIIGQPVPRNQEAGSLINLAAETYSNSNKETPVITPNEAFLKSKQPFKFNTRGAQ